MLTLPDIVLSEQLGPLPEIVPPPPPGLEMIRRQELVPQPIKPTERNRVARKTFCEPEIARRKASTWRIGRPRFRDYPSRNRRSQGHDEAGRAGTDWEVGEDREMASGVKTPSFLRRTARLKPCPDDLPNSDTGVGSRLPFAARGKKLGSATVGAVRRGGRPYGILLRNSRPEGESGSKLRTPEGNVARLNLECGGLPPL